MRSSSPRTVDLCDVIDDVEVVIDRVSTILDVLNSPQSVVEYHPVVTTVTSSLFLRVCAICSALRSGTSHGIRLAI